MKRCQKGKLTKLNKDNNNIIMHKMVSFMLTSNNNPEEILLKLMSFKSFFLHRCNKHFFKHNCMICLYIYIYMYTQTLADT